VAAARLRPHANRVRRRALRGSGGGASRRCSRPQPSRRACRDSEGAASKPRCSASVNCGAAHAGTVAAAVRRGDGLPAREPGAGRSRRAPESARARARSRTGCDATRALGGELGAMRDRARAARDDRTHAARTDWGDIISPEYASAATRCSR
jgi:hypothetical protein